MNDLGQAVLLAEPDASTDSSVDRLVALADHMESFLCAQIQQLQGRLLEATRAGNAPQDRLDTLVVEFQSQRNDWELNRQEELCRLRQEADALAEAWHRLEDEQRRLFAERERLRAGMPPAGRPARAAASTSRPASSREKHLEKQTTAVAEPHASSATWWQLEQLRLEIQKHARRGP